VGQVSVTLDCARHIAQPLQTVRAPDKQVMSWGNERTLRQITFFKFYTVYWLSCKKAIKTTQLRLRRIVACSGWPPRSFVGEWKYTQHYFEWFETCTFIY